MDLPSDSDESDVDFVPDEEITKSDVESEAEADKETEDQYEEALSKKRCKASVTRPMKKAKLNEDEVNEGPKENKNASSTLDPQQAKKYEDDLWASFLTPTQSKNAEPSQDKSLKESKNTEEKKEKSGPDLDLKTTDEKEKPVNTTSSKDLTPGRSCVTAPVPITKKPAGGLASIISKIGKKDKMSTLERSKLDWMSFKRQEGIEEEIQTHNRGKDGYLERQDFLQRTDHRQYEIEKSLRLNKKSSR